MIESHAKKSVSRNILLVILFIGFGLIVCSAFFAASVQADKELEKVANPAARQNLYRFRFRTDEGWQGLLRFAGHGRELDRNKFLDWRKDLDKIQSLLQESWLNESAEKINLQQMLELQNNLESAGSDILNRVASGENIPTEVLNDFRSKGTEFSGLATAASDYASEQMTEAHQKLFVQRQQLNLVVAITIGLALLLMLVVIFTLRRNFNEYVAIKESSEKKVSDSEDRFRKIFDNEPQCVKLFDLDGKLLDMNSAGLAIIGARNIEEVRGQSIYDLIQPKDRQFFIDSAHALAEAEEMDEVQSIEFDIESLDGIHRSMQSYQVPIPSDDSDNFTILAITYDVTEKKKSEQELKELKDAMVNAGRLNVVGELASNMAHELNQPLTSTVNFAYMLDSEVEKVDSPNAQKLASLILTESMRASKIVEGLRRLVDKQPCATAWENVNDIVTKTLPLIQDDIRQLQVKVVQYLTANLPRVKCDKVQIQQVLYNLVKNAMDSFATCHPSKKKQLVIETRVTEDQKHVELSIQDTAKGIPESHIEAIFSPFVSHNDNGLGMGLAIAKSIAQAHSGMLKVSSTIGEGTCFKLLLPLEESMALESEPQEATI